MNELIETCVQIATNVKTRFSAEILCQSDLQNKTKKMIFIVFRLKQVLLQSHIVNMTEVINFSSRSVYTESHDGNFLYFFLQKPSLRK